jgi:hypothetical protein
MKLTPLIALPLLLAGCNPASTTDSQTTKTTTTVTTTTAGSTTDAAPPATPAVTAPIPSPMLTQANLDRIQNDMSKTEVESILGSPTSSTTEPIPIVGGTQTTYSYQSGNSTITIVFKNDMVKEKSGNFGP